MTIDVGGAFFLRPGSICRVALIAGWVGVLVPAGGCTSTSPGSTTPVGLTQGPQDTGSYPNLNVPPKVANKQFTKEETADYCERVLRGYLDRRQPGERFAAYVARAEEEWLL